MSDAVSRIQKFSELYLHVHVCPWSEIYFDWLQNDAILEIEMDLFKLQTTLNFFVWVISYFNYNITYCIIHV